MRFLYCGTCTLRVMECYTQVAWCLQACWYIHVDDPHELKTWLGKNIGPNLISNHVSKVRIYRANMQFRNLLRRSWFLSWGERPVLNLKGVHLKAGEQMLELGIHLFKNEEHSHFLPWQSLPIGQLCRNRRGTSPQYQNRYLDLVVCYKFVKLQIIHTKWDGNAVYEEIEQERKLTVWLGHRQLVNQDTPNFSP